jgi:hypothetical protein
MPDIVAPGPFTTAVCMVAARGVIESHFELYPSLFRTQLQGKIIKTPKLNLLFYPYRTATYLYLVHGCGSNRYPNQK